jgi:hypothetical protein
MGQDCQPYATAAFPPLPPPSRDDTCCSFRLEAESMAIVRISKTPIENRTHDLPACNAVSQPITVQRNPPDGSIVNKLPHFPTALRVTSFVFGPLFSPHTSAKLSRFLVFKNEGSPYMILVVCSDLELCPLWREGDGVGMTQWSHLQKYGALVLLAVVWPPVTTGWMSTHHVCSTLPLDKLWQI